MSDWDVPSIHKMYSIADRCLNDKKTRRPDIKMVCSLADKGLFWVGDCVCVPCVWLQDQLIIFLSVLLQVQQHLQEIKT